jgi:AbrB family looped-hinge helix DNA binding protein
MHVVTSKGQVTIPKELRERLGLRPGDRVEFLLHEGEVVLRKRERLSLVGLGRIARARRAGRRG